MSHIRPSSPRDPSEWHITEDGHHFNEGDRLYNYYDCKWGVISGEISSYDGWFQFTHDDGTITYLNCVRVSTIDPKER